METTYTVVPGDICLKVAAQFGITLQELYARNPQVNPQCTNLYPGQALRIGRGPVEVGGPSGASGSFRSPFGGQLGPVGQVGQVAAGNAPGLFPGAMNNPALG
jgi:hypothetical protein